MKAHCLELAATFTVIKASSKAVCMWLQSAQPGPGGWWGAPEPARREALTQNWKSIGWVLLTSWRRGPRAGAELDGKLDGAQGLEKPREWKGSMWSTGS